MIQPYPAKCWLRFTRDLVGWSAMGSVPVPAGSIGKLQFIGPPVNERGWYTLTVMGGKLVDCRYEDVRPVCRVSLDHALGQGWIDDVEWFAGVVSLD